jgi:hypothetical protein
MGLIRDSSINNHIDVLGVSFEEIAKKLRTILNIEYPKLVHTSIGKVPELVRTLRNLTAVIIPIEYVYDSNLNICGKRVGIRIQISFFIRLDSENSAYKLSSIIENLSDKFSYDKGFRTIDNLVSNVIVEKGTLLPYIQERSRLYTASMTLQIKYKK